MTANAEPIVVGRPAKQGKSIASRGLVFRKLPTHDVLFVCIVDVRRRHAGWQSSHRPRCRLAHAHEHHRIRGLSAILWHGEDGIVINFAGADRDDAVGPRTNVDPCA